MKEGQGSGGHCPVTDLFELPGERDGCEGLVSVVVDPVVLLHEDIFALIAVKAVLNLQTGDQEVGEVQDQEN